MTEDELRENSARLVERGWTQHAYSRNAYGDAIITHDVSPAHLDAAEWCATGAIYAASDGHLDLANNLINKIERNQLGEHPLDKWNDKWNRTAEQVAEVLRGKVVGVDGR